MSEVRLCLGRPMYLGAFFIRESSMYRSIELKYVIALQQEAELHLSVESRF